MASSDELAEAPMKACTICMHEEPTDTIFEHEDAVSKQQRKDRGREVHELYVGSLA